jgi:hypothetical protein
MEVSAQTVVSLQHFSECNILHFLCGAVAMEQLRTYMLAHTSSKTTARPPVFVCRPKQVET